MKEFFVIGNKASTSLSPLIFNYWFKKYKIKAKYSFVEVKKNNFNKEIKKKINNKNTAGFNVTIPYKTKIIEHLDSINKHSKNIGAVNCVTIGKKNKGINTDWLGYLNSIKSEKLNKNKKIIMLGCGGASRAIFYGLKLKGYQKVYVFNRTKKAIKTSPRIFYTKEYRLIDDYLLTADLLINTTPTNPLNKKQIKLIGKKTIISDIVYTPKETVFLKSFDKNNKIYGITMLIEQAIPCFHHWFGFKPIVNNKMIKKIYSKI